MHILFQAKKRKTENKESKPEATTPSTEQQPEPEPSKVTLKYSPCRIQTGGNCCLLNFVLSVTFCQSCTVLTVIGITSEVCL